MASVFIDVLAPTINILKDSNIEQDCVSVEILTSQNETLNLHFSNKHDLIAFVGLLNLATGNKNGNVSGA